jgi:23S rRNA-/tRNA-specific pseudouridylate synthase
LSPGATLPILLEEDEILAVDKPPGLPSTGRDLDDPECVQWRLQEQIGHPVWAVHQLDKDTSGVLIFTRHKRWVQSWQKKLAAGSKVYQAIVHGSPPWEKMVVDAPLLRKGKLMCVEPEGKPAKTTLTVRVRGSEHALIEARIHTGRTHQVRVHVAHLGHPLVGEKLYRDPPCELAPRHALHAWRVKAAGRTIEAPLPADLREMRSVLLK